MYQRHPASKPRHARLFNLLQDQQRRALVTARLRQRSAYVDQATAQSLQQSCLKSLQAVNPVPETADRPKRAPIRPIWPQVIET